MKQIGIIGAGIAGLHLGLFLRKHGIAATIYTEKTPEQQLGLRLPNVVCRNALTRERERQLGVNYWDSAAPDLMTLSFSLRGPRTISFAGDLIGPSQAVDMRMYGARLLEEFSLRGGKTVIGSLSSGDLDGLATEHDLVVVASGRGSLCGMFPRVAEHSPNTKPQRLVVLGLYHGIGYPDPIGFEVVVNPGHGEILCFPILSFEPHLCGLGIEIATGGAFETLRDLRYEDDARGFDHAVLGLLRDYAPAIYARIDRDAFALARPLDLGHVAITPTVRRGYTGLSGGRFAIALGDAHVVIDPITGQGANKASHAAWVLGEAIVAGDSFDEPFCQRVEQQVCSYALPVSDAANARLRPPQPHAVELLRAAGQHQAIANIYSDGFNHPDRFWAIVSSAERTAALLREFGWEATPAATPQTIDAALAPRQDSSHASAS